MRKLLALAVLIPLFLMADAGYTRAPDFARVDDSGHKLQLSKLKGKVVLLDFWATWCTGCKQEIPWYVEFESKYKKSGLDAVGVAMDDEGWQIVKPFLKDHLHLNYPVVVGDKMLARQFGGVDMLPVTLLIDREGRIAYSHTGVVNRDEFENKIQELLAGAR